MSAFKNITTDSITLSNRITLNNLPLSSSPNQILQTNALNEPVYENNILFNKSFRFGVCWGSFSSSDWNLNTTNTLALDNVFNSSSQSFGPNTFNNITKTSVTALTCNTTALYKITMMAQITNAGISTSRIGYNVLLNGIVQFPSSQIELDASRTGMLTSSIILQINAGNIITFRTARISGTSAMNCVGVNSNFLVECLSTLI
jgi:hypothetical protein